MTLPFSVIGKRIKHMAIEFVDRYTRSMLRARPDTLFVFGDNLAQYGRRGQAKECRGEPNAVGIPTKKRPSMDENAFFTNADFAIAKAAIDRGFLRLAVHVREGGVVVMPANGLGTGLAQLPTRAPMIHAYILKLTVRLREVDQESCLAREPVTVLAS